MQKEQEEFCYVGTRPDGPGSGIVRIRVGKTKTTDLPPRFDLANHSPDGFEWGYGGSGPAQLALAIAAHALGDDELAKLVYQDFKFEVIAGIRDDNWTLSRLVALQSLNRLIATSPRLARKRLEDFGDALGCNPDGTIWERPWPIFSKAEQMVVELGKWLWADSTIEALQLPRSSEIGGELMELARAIDPGVEHLESHLAHKARHGT